MTSNHNAAPYGLAALAWAATIFWLSSAPRSLPPPLAVDGMDKLLHLGTFAVLAWLCRATLQRAAPEQAVRFHVVTAAVVAVAYGLSDELHQAYVPGRQASFYDVLADGAGALLGAAGHCLDQHGRSGEMAKKILALVAVVLGFLVGIIAMEPDTTHIQRSVEIQATPAQVWPHVLDLHRFVKWSPWAGMDPNQKVTFEGPETGVGASYSWAGNDQVGKGKMTVSRVVPNEAVRVNLEFIEPFASKADVGYTLTPTGGGTKVMWWYDSPNTFMTKAMGLVMNMDKMLGGDFDRGLASLKKIVEEEAKAAPAAPAPAQPAEPAPAAAGSSGGAAAPK